MSVADHIIEAITVAPGAPADLRGRDPDAAGKDGTIEHGVLSRTVDGLDLAPPTVSPEKLAAIDEARVALLAET
jgi:hypothetical protein